MHRRFLFPLLICLPALAQQPTDLQHHIAAIEEGKFNGWPANNGVWQWDNEILARKFHRGGIFEAARGIK